MSVHDGTEPQGFKDLIPTPVRRSLAGGVAAAFGKTLTAPLERVRIIRQAGSRGSSSSCFLLKDIYQTDGMRGLWRGNAVNLSRVIPSYAVRFTVFGQLSDYGSNFPFLTNPFVTGALSGTASALASYPLEVLRTRLSISGSLLDAFRQGRLFAGCSLTVLETTPYAALTLGTFSYLEHHYPSATVRDKIAHGFIAGALGTMVCFPLDTLRRNKIVHASEPIPRIAANLYSNGGIGRFYRGLGVAVTKAAPTVAFTLLVNDYLLGKLDVR